MPEQRSQPPVPHCPKCHSSRTVQVFEHLGGRSFFCADCEHTWTATLRDRKRDQQTLPVAVLVRQGLERRRPVSNGLDEQFNANAITYQVVSERTNALIRTAAAKLAHAAAIVRASRHRRLLAQLARRREHAVH